MTDAYAHVLVDGHVHFHGCFSLHAFLEHAARNFSRQAAELGWTKDWAGVLMLAEMRDQSWFRSLLESLEPGEKTGWTLVRTGETTPALIASCSNRPDLILVPGRQVVTSERLEVLTLGTEQYLRDGLPVTEVLDWAGRYDAIAVLPWGAGKWLGRRGSVVNAIIRDTAGTSAVLLGDSGIRPRAWRRPRQFVRAQRAGMRVLPGTDPLPMVDEQQRVGAFGAVVDAPVDRADPVGALKRLLPGQTAPLSPYGRLQANGRFLRSQLRLRMRLAWSLPGQQRNERQSMNRP